MMSRAPLPGRSLGHGRLMLALALVAAAALLPPAPARAATEALSVLIEERARDTLGPTLPENGTVEVTLAPGAVERAVMLSAFWMDTATGRFVANAVTPAGQVQRVSGLALLTVDVPVPNRRMLPGEIVTEADLATVTLPHGRLSAFALTETTKLVGMQVRRVLTQGRPIVAQSIQPPQVIDRGDQITIRYSDGNLSLAAPGRALAGAALGEDVKIVNLVSNTSLVGTATGKGIVEVSQ